MSWALRRPFARKPWQLRGLLGEIDAHFVRWLATTETALRPEPIPLARTVGYQLDMSLSAADLLSN
ncbi:hypothetical protein ABT063_10485 [Streptomyces sp. NPDC002838]|uniref:hypothetical protein n=1 Tax=Streptomyces sp. NPDC002838 TaxID=3154436 RepID=UPI00332D0A8B